MDVHELPSIMEGNDMVVIEEGMSSLFEPGIYIPGKVGVTSGTAAMLQRMAFELFTEANQGLVVF